MFWKRECVEFVGAIHAVAVSLVDCPARPATADPDRLARFQREAEAIAALSHPNIVTIYSIEREGDVRFLTMELVDGQSLSQAIPRAGCRVVGTCTWQSGDPRSTMSR